MPVCPPVRRTFSDERGTGTFHSLGVLPKRKHDSSAPKFHIPTEDDLDQPPSLDDIHASAHPATVPFPRASSPPSPQTRSSTSSCPSSPTSGSEVSRESTSILLPNGKPLKSSLKSSSSSPAMLIPPHSQHMHLRARSEPSTPAATPKNVHFPDKDYALATIRIFDRSARPAALSNPNNGNGNGDETETEGEDTPPSRFPFPPVPPIFNYEIDPTKSSPVPSRGPRTANLFLESLNISPSSYSSSNALTKPLLSGSILVYNLAFEKSVAVRFTLDDWQTVSEVGAHYVDSLGAFPPHIFPPPDSFPKTRGRGWDRFTFVIRLEDYAHSLSTRTLWLAVHYRVNSTYPEPGSELYGPGGEWWDNNGGANYRIEFRPTVTSSTFPRSRPRRETVSAPISSSRSHIQHPSTNKEHAMGLITPSLFSHKGAQPASSANSRAMPRAGKLNLCNYTPPTVRVAPPNPPPSDGSKKNVISASPAALRSSHDDCPTPASSTLSTPSASPVITPSVIIGGQPATPTQPGLSKDNDGSVAGHIADWDWSAPSKLRLQGLRRHHTDFSPSSGRDLLSDDNSLYDAFLSQWCYAKSSPSNHNFGDVGIMT